MIGNKSSDKQTNAEAKALVLYCIDIKASCLYNGVF